MKLVSSVATHGYKTSTIKMSKLICRGRLAFTNELNASIVKGFICSYHVRFAGDTWPNVSITACISGCSTMRYMAGGE
jgi:hypothetical protein